MEAKSLNHSFRALALLNAPHSSNAYLFAGGMIESASV